MGTALFPLYHKKISARPVTLPHVHVASGLQDSRGRLHPRHVVLRSPRVHLSAKVKFLAGPRALVCETMPQGPHDLGVLQEGHCEVPWNLA